MPTTCAGEASSATWPDWTEHGKIIARFGPQPDGQKHDASKLRSRRMRHEFAPPRSGRPGRCRKADGAAFCTALPNVSAIEDLQKLIASEKTRAKTFVTFINPLKS
jgi:hypothetical protein